MSKKPSGTEYRKRKINKDREEQKQTGSFLKYLRQEQESISSYANETSNSETDDIHIMTNTGQPKHNEDLNIITISNQEAEILIIDETLQSHQNCQVSIQNNELKPLSLNDISSWPVPLEAALITELISKGPIQNKEGPFTAAIRNGTQTKGEIRTMSTAWFYRQLDNDEKMLRTWIVYSTVSESLYCFCCRLFASENPKHIQTTFIRNGFRQ